MSDGAEQGRDEGGGEGQQTLVPDAEESQPCRRSNPASASASACSEDREGSWHSLDFDAQAAPPNQRGGSAEANGEEDRDVANGPSSACEPLGQDAAIGGSETELGQGGGVPATSSTCQPALQPPAESSPPATSEGVGPSRPESPHSVEQRIWCRRQNKCPGETDADLEWYRHKRHVLIFTCSGRPVYTRYGSEDGISRTTGALSAIVAKMAVFFFGRPGQPSDSLQYMLAGEHMFVFVERGPLWLVCISRCGDAYADVVRLLERVHLQIITILTGQIEQRLTNHPNYDMRSLLGGTEGVVNSMVRWCTQDMYLQLEGFEPLPLAPGTRSIAIEALRSARVPNVLCGFLMASHRLLAIVTNRQFKLCALDLSMIINLVMSSAALRTGESWTPVCLPHLSDKAFAYAYISFLEDSDVGLVFLSTACDGEQFYAISKQSSNIKQTLMRSGCLAAIKTASSLCPIDMRVVAGGAGTPAASGSSPLSPRDGGSSGSSSRNERAATSAPLAPGPAGQWHLLEGIIHAAHFLPAHQQYFSSSFALHYQSRRTAKRLLRGYGRCRLLLRGARLPAQICITTDHECFYVSLAADFQVYMTVPRGLSFGVIGQFYQWVKSQESHIFLGSLPTW